MPIYGYGTLGAPWIIDNNVPVKRMASLMKIFNKALHEFKYHGDHVFVNSITINLKMEYCYVAKYDYSKTTINLAVYQDKMETLIKYANDLLSQKKQYKDQKFDIQGSWTVGKVIIMKRNPEYDKK